MTMKKKVTLIVAGITLILSSVSFADDLSGFAGPPAFEEVDTNGDLQISRDELDAAMERRMSGHDGPVRMLGGRMLRNGSLDDKAPGFRAAPTFAEVDSNGDLIVTQEEFDAFMEQRAPMHHRVRCRCTEDGVGPFDRADADGDGMLSQEEYAGMMEKVRILRKGD
jgi:hypothetical protein